MTLPDEAQAPGALERARSLHLLVGWGGLFLFACLGLVLEGLHAFKADSFLHVEAESRRFLLRLAHAHGTGLGLLQLGFAFTLDAVGGAAPARWLRGASSCLLLAGCLLPAGFLLGALGSSSDDPGYGILLVPVGAAFLLLGLALTMASCWRANRR